jgi:malonyl-CoA O-methyltransferase
MPRHIAHAQRHFDRVAPRFPDHDALLREVEARLFERIAMMKLAPQRIADLGCGRGQGLLRLARHFPQAVLLGLDVARQMLKHARGSDTAWRTMRRTLAQWMPGLVQGVDNIAWVQGDFARTPIARNSVDLVYSNLALHYSCNPAEVLQEWSATLRDGGLLLFSCLGPDTLKELRKHWPAPDVAFMPLTDMHDLGDMLMRAGLVNPVMEMETITMTYPDAKALKAELAALAWHPLQPEHTGLKGRMLRLQMEAALNANAREDGRLGVTIEVITGHAWCVAPSQKTLRAADGSSAVHVSLDRIGMKPRRM